MPERRTLLSQSSPDVGPIKPSTIDAPAGAFGDERGMSNFGSALQDAASTGVRIASERIAQLHQLGDQRDASDIHARLQLAINQQAQGLYQDYTNFTTPTQNEDGTANPALSNDPLMSAVNDSAQKRLKAIGDSMADMRTRNPRVYDQLITPNTIAATWSGHVDNVQRAAINFSAEKNQQDRYETAVKSDDIMFTSAAASPDGSLKAAQAVYADLSRRGDMFTAQQRSQRRASAQANVFQAMMGSATLTPGQGVIDASQKARDQGFVSPEQHAHVVAEVARQLKPANINHELRITATNLNETIKSGDQVGITAGNTTLAAALQTYDTPSARYSEVVKPRVLSLMEGKLRNNTANGFLAGGNLQSAQTILGELDKPQSQMIDTMFEQDYRDTLAQQFNAMPGLQKSVEGNVDYQASAQDLANYRTALRSTLQKQTDMVDHYQVHELYKSNPGVVAAIQTGNMASIVRVQRSLYDRDGIPENRRVYGDPSEIEALNQQMSKTDEASVAQTAQMVTGLVNHYGKDGYGALMSVAQAPGATAGIVRTMAQQFVALNKDAADGITSMLPDLIQAVSWASSTDAKKVNDTDPTFKRDTDAFWNAAFSSRSSDDFNSKKAWALLQDGKLISAPESSPLGQAAMRDGTYASIHDLGLALTQYYAAGKKDRVMSRNDAAAEARKVIGRAFVPLYSTGAGADSPVYTFGPVTKRQTAWYTGANKGAFNDDRQYAQLEGAAWDSMFMTNDPKFSLGGKMQWEFNLALTGLLNGPRIGMNTELAQMPNLDPAFWNVVRTVKDNAEWKGVSTTAFNMNPIDFKNVGVAFPGKDGKDEFVPLSEDKIVTDFLPLTVQEKVKALLKTTEPDDVAGRNQLVLANNFQRELNTKTQSWDVYISGGRNYDGTAGISSKVGPRASVVVRQADGSLKKLSISVADADNRLEAMTAASSWTNREGSNNQLRKELLGTPPSPKKH